MLVDLLKDVFGVYDLCEDTQCYVSNDGVLHVALPDYCDPEYLEFENGQYMTIEELEELVTSFVEDEYGEHERVLSTRCIQLEDYGVISFYCSKIKLNNRAKSNDLVYSDWYSRINL